MSPLEIKFLRIYKQKSARRLVSLETGSVVILPSASVRLQMMCKFIKMQMKVYFKNLFHLI